MAEKAHFEARLTAIRYEAEGISSFELCPLPGRSLPRFTAGAHVDLHLGNGQIRSYSLLNSQDEVNRYVIAVNKDPNSRGGSSFMHERLAVGNIVTCSGPRNNFPLFEDAPHSVLIAGGIGITPTLSMISRLQSLGRSWELHYAARSRKNAAFLDHLNAFDSKLRLTLNVNIDDETGGKLLNITDIVASHGADAHFYCCGPIPMLEAFERATAAIPGERVHVEYFAAKEQPSVAGGFEVVLAQSGKTLHVAPGKTILDAVMEAGVDVPSSCLQGACGSCETAVLEGIPDHRDVVLSKEERAANRTMMICCSGSKTERLVLDL